MHNHTSCKNWSIDYDIQNIAWLTLDREDEQVNSLSMDVLSELEVILEQLEANTPAGVIFISGKDSGFIAGADIREFEAISDIAQAKEGVQRAHVLFNRVESLRCPTVAAIDGFCLGGGLELALACDYRIALDSEKTRIGFPEIQLGIFPGFGGTARSIRHLGGRKAMELMLGARMLNARKAKSAGLIDQLVDRHGSLHWAARNAVLKKRKSRPAGKLEQLTSLPAIRHALAKIMEREVDKRVRRDHYPAPYALIDLWRAVGNDFKALLDGEANETGKLLLGDTSTSLRRVFRLQELLKEQGKADQTNKDWQPRRVHVIGAGVMGGDIAAWCALRGFEVTVQDREMKYVEPALKRAEKLFWKKLKTRIKVDAANRRMMADIEGDGIARADIIIEAIYENLDAKQQLFQSLEQAAKPDAVLASNTSAIPLEDIASSMQQPARLIGLHFFNPVAMMPLVEVVRGQQSDPVDIKRGCVFANNIGKFPLPVKSAPGFLVNRVLTPYMLEALELQKQGYSIETIDAAAEQFGMPMGPVELIDTVGLDVGASVAAELSPDNIGAQEQIQAMVAAGKLGKKSGEGFYRWEKGKAVKSSFDHAAPLGSLGKQLVQPLLDECQQCLNEGIVESAELLDGGVIFGTGFAPFRGGPLHYLSQQSVSS